MAVSKWRKSKLKNIIYEDSPNVYSEQVKLNVCCFRELEDVNVFILWSTLFILSAKAGCFMCPPRPTEETHVRGRPELSRQQNSEFSNLTELWCSAASFWISTLMNKILHIPKLALLSLSLSRSLPTHTQLLFWCSIYSVHWTPFLLHLNCLLRDFAHLINPSSPLTSPSWAALSKRSKASSHL